MANFAQQKIDGWLAYDFTPEECLNGIMKHSRLWMDKGLATPGEIIEAGTKLLEKITDTTH